MKSKIKINDLNIGDIFYEVRVSSNNPSVKTHVVTAVETFPPSKDRNNLIKVDYEGSHYYSIGRWGSYTTRSIKKAERVRELTSEQDARANKRWEETTKIREENKANIKEVEDALIGKEVMVRVPTKDGTWKKSKILAVVAGDEPGLYYFRANRNMWRSDREGKNWEFWTREKELKRQRDKINKELAQLRKKKSRVEES